MPIQPNDNQKYSPTNFAKSRAEFYKTNNFKNFQNRRGGFARIYAEYFERVNFFGNRAGFKQRRLFGLRIWNAVNETAKSRRFEFFFAKRHGFLSRFVHQHREPLSDARPAANLRNFKKNVFNVHGNQTKFLLPNWKFSVRSKFDCPEFVRRNKRWSFG